MNEFIVTLKCDLNDDIVRYFSKRGCNIIYKDDVIKGTIIIETVLTREEVNNLQYVEEAKESRIGRMDIQEVGTWSITPNKYTQQQ